VVSNFSSTILIVILLGVHPLVWLAWLTFRVLNTYEVHSGYDPIGPTFTLVHSHAYMQ
jgi:hypothetical protein